MTDEQQPPTYQEKIQELLKKVSNGIEIFPKPKEPTRVEKTIKEKGVKGAITSIFLKENTWDYTLKEQEGNDEESLRIGQTPFYRIKIPSNYSDADTYWKTVIPRIRNAGKVTTSSEGSATIDFGGDKTEPSLMKVEIVRDSSQHEKPYLMFSWEDGEVVPKDKVLGVLKKVGLATIENEVVEQDGKVFVQAQP